MKLIIFIILLPIFVFIFWMNMTPGHFQYGSCGCEISYIKDDNKPRCVIGCLPGSTSEEFIKFIKKKSALLDFNK